MKIVSTDANRVQVIVLSAPHLRAKSVTKQENLHFKIRDANVSVVQLWLMAFVKLPHLSVLKIALSVNRALCVQFVCEITF